MKDTHPLESGIPDLNEPTAYLAFRKKAGFIFLVLVIIGLIGYTFLRLNAHKDQAVAKKSQVNVQNNAPKKNFDEQTAGLSQRQSELLKDQPWVVGDTQMPFEKTKPVDPFDVDKSASPLMAESGVGLNPSQPRQLEEKADVGHFSAPLSSTRTESRQATFLKNRHYLVAKGTLIPCALQTRLDSTVPGMTGCLVTRNIYSDSGKVLLIERGSTLSGEYQANVKRGQARIFVLWNRIKTPSGVVVNLDSPGTDELGGSGLPGYVDDHFWQRFGGAILLSLVQDIGAAAANSIDAHKNRITFNNTADSSQNMAVEALKNTINIPPTLYKNQGESVGVLVARDLDFRQVYELQLH